MTTPQQAPRVTKSDIEAQIAKIQYINAGAASRAAGSPDSKELNVLTICFLTTQSGFTVSGESACVSPENFDEELGKKYAYEAAFNKLWQLFGFNLKQKIYEEGRKPGEDMTETFIEVAARTAHAVNNEIRRFKDPNEVVVPWDAASDAQRESTKAGITALMRNPHLTAEQQHELWFDHMKAQGWSYGPVKDEATKTHPCMVKYSQLDAGDRLKDATFQAVVRGVLGL